MPDTSLRLTVGTLMATVIDYERRMSHMRGALSLAEMALETRLDCVFATADDLALCEDALETVRRAIVASDAPPPK